MLAQFKIFSSFALDRSSSVSFPFLPSPCSGSSKFENPLKPCCTGISTGYNCGSVDTNGAKKYAVCDDPEAAFFWDTVHPTQEGWRAVYSALLQEL